MTRFTSRCYWAWLLLGSCTLSAAQTTSSGDFLEMSLEELVDYRLMSMSRKEQRVADMAAAAHVVTAEEIRRSGAMSIPEALRLVPGLNVAQIASNRWAVSARGFNDRLAGKLLVLVDGRTIYSPSFSGVLWESQDLVMEDIERIEVIRGPGAALWGTNAMNGVINIITRSAAASQGNMVSTSLGSNSQSIVSMIHGGELAAGGYYKRDNLFLPAGPYLLTDGLDQRVNYSAFVHDEWTLEPDRFKLIVGNKFEHDGLTGWNMQPNVRTLFTPNANEAFWTALSRSVRSPRRTQSLATADLAADDVTKLYPGLPIPPNALTAMAQFSPLPGARTRAEQAWTLEGGWRRQFSSFLSVDTSLFYSEYSRLSAARLLSTDLAGAMSPQVQACLANVANLGRCYIVIPGYNSNEEKARSWGGETAMEWHLRPWWKMQASYSYVRVKGVRTGDLLADSMLRGTEDGTPRHQIMLNNHWRLAADWSLNAALRYQSSTTFYALPTLSTVTTTDAIVVPAYTGLDARLAWQYDRRTELSVSGRNLLKNRHTEFISSMPYTQAFDVWRSVLFQAVVRF